MTDSFLDKVYAARTAEETRAVYDAWSKSYEAEVAENGYATPGRCAAALHAIMADTNAPILDFGCGTGLSGLALRLAGFTVIDGLDLSPDMLAIARDKGLYRDLSQTQANDPLPRGYAAIAAIGVIGAGAAPLAVLDRIIDALEPGGFTVFSFNDHTLEDPSYQARVEALMADGTVTERFREHGPHLPGRDLNATVYVLEKN
ncbi:class I SAM-dependent DNA methyltransferase [Aestuariicoccus sp. MJ-SS9]|uniref:class I SAM-dependent DNA methyltransferase n=1 Tax=Aestuariicoccus sp. MJ-SS9 TaxID=3079855 RepID=UPI00290F8103|nr:methyltransferase domain-containing protein [Aestuariicoccus sp. MJ-SS9]MDU8911558.1 methyltransferase domain-containing protein [Aestuariicoccus sp. MJ-SS9]